MSGARVVFLGNAIIPPLNSYNIVTTPDSVIAYFTTLIDANTAIQNTVANSKILIYDDVTTALSLVDPSVFVMTFADASEILSVRTSKTIFKESERGVYSAGNEVLDVRERDIYYWSTPGTPQHFDNEDYDDDGNAVYTSVTGPNLAFTHSENSTTVTLDNGSVLQEIDYTTISETFLSDYLQYAD